MRVATVHLDEFSSDSMDTMTAHKGEPRRGTEGFALVTRQQQPPFLGGRRAEIDAGLRPL